jgi:hypothetical protein
MDWKYKHYNLENEFQARPDEVLEVARLFVSDSLGWKIVDTDEGFDATGSSFAHATIARFRVTPSLSGAKLRVELLVERASSLGFMLFDVGGYYSRQLRNWIAGIRWHLNERLRTETGTQSVHQASGGGPNPGLSPGSMSPWNSSSSKWTKIFAGCLILTVTIPVLIFVIAPVIGLLSGHLYIPGRGGSDITVHGRWARIISAVILLLEGWLLWRIRRKPKASIGP